MKYNFDEIIDRHNTNSLKYDFATERGKSANILPLWVADMDFKSPPEVLNVLSKTVSHGIFGYTEAKTSYYETVSNWFYKNFHWNNNPHWIVKTPGVVFALATAVKAYTNEGDSVLIQQPVYYPFSEVILDNNRKLVNNPLIIQNGHYRIDFVDFEKKIIDNNVKLFILCSPHNPVGRVWTKKELITIGNICIKHNVLIISDEIHCDFTFPGNTHTVFASINKQFEKNSIVCTAPSKTFNFAGIQVANIFIPNLSLRKQFIKTYNQSGYSQLNTFGIIGAKACYELGSPWLTELKIYLLDNLKFLREYLLNHIPSVKLMEPEGTYLVWLDFRGLNLTNKELENLIVKKANLWLDSGEIFGKEGEGFQRINIACPRSTLKKALDHLNVAVNQH